MNGEELRTVTHPGENPETPRANDAAQNVRREVYEFVRMVLLFLALFIVLKTFVLEGYEVQGPSMEPTLHNSERILVFKLPHVLRMDSIGAGDIVVFDSTDDADKRYVKRVVAKGPKPPHDNTVVAIGEGSFGGRGVSVSLESGRLYVDHHLVHESYLPEEIRESFNATDPERDLAPGEFYVLGDNRNVSKDSRSFGPIDDQKIIGKAVLRFWPLSKFSILR
jgi:signal peptidase I